MEFGYRLIDTAVNYGNEADVGRAIRQSGLARDDIQITSKLPGRHHAYDDAIDQTIQRRAAMAEENGAEAEDRDGGEDDGLRMRHGLRSVMDGSIARGRRGRRFELRRDRDEFRPPPRR